MAFAIFYNETLLIYFRQLRKIIDYLINYRINFK